MFGKPRDLARYPLTVPAAGSSVVGSNLSRNQVDDRELEVLSVPTLSDEDGYIVSARIKFPKKMKKEEKVRLLHDIKHNTIVWGRPSEMDGDGKYLLSILSPPEHDGSGNKELDDGQMDDSDSEFSRWEKADRLLYRYELSQSRFKDIFEVFSLTHHTSTIILPGEQRLKSVRNVSQEDFRYHLRGGLSGSPPRSLVQGHAYFLEISRMHGSERERLLKRLALTRKEEELVMATSEFMHHLIDFLEVPEPILLFLALTAHQIQFIGADKILDWFFRGSRREYTGDLRMWFGGRVLVKLARRCRGIMLWEHYDCGLKLSESDEEYLHLSCYGARGRWAWIQSPGGFGGCFPDSGGYWSPLDED